MARMKDQLEMAQFRFGMIAPAIQGTFTDKSRAAYYRRVTAAPLKRPDGTAYLYSPQTLHCWELAYRAGGMDALIVQPRSDRGMPRVLSDEAIQAIFAAIEQFPKLPATQVRQKLLADGVISAKVTDRCFQRFIKGRALRSRSAAAQKDRRAFEAERFGVLWQADSCHFPYIREGGKGEARKTYLLAIIDDHSRMVVAAELFHNDNAANFQKLLKGAIATYGMPVKLYVDHGSPYDNSQIAFICGSVGTALIHAPVRDGASKGKVERLFRTVKETWLYGIDVASVKSLGEFNRMLAEFTRGYNLTTHSSTGETPMDRFLRTRGQARTPISREWLDNAFLNRERRTVRSDGTLQIRNVQFDVPLQFIGQTVDVRFLPDSLDEAFIFSGKDRIALRKTNKAENARAKRGGARIDYGWKGPGAAGGVHV